MEALNLFFLCNLRKYVLLYDALLLMEFPLQKLSTWLPKHLPTAHLLDPAHKLLQLHQYLIAQHLPLAKLLQLPDLFFLHAFLMRFPELLLHIKYVIQSEMKLYLTKPLAHFLQQMLPFHRTMFQSPILKYLYY